MGRQLDISAVSFLVIEDNAYMLSIIRTLLIGFGVKRIQDAPDAAEAFEIFQNSQIDVIIVDYALETLNGVEFSQLARNAKDSPNPYVPIIMLTAHSERSRVEEARDAGITEFLCKPISAANLYARIVAVLERPRSFVRAKEFFGPDRRRRADDVYRGDERRKDNLERKPPAEDDGESAEIEIDVCD